MKLSLVIPSTTWLRSEARRAGGFTLVEVILAISIAIGILVVALYFYQQSSKLRSELLEESERLAAIRLLMDRISNDLRAAMIQPQVPFFGDSSAMRFVKAELPSREFLSGNSREGLGIQTDLRKIAYGVQFSQDGTNRTVRGVTRTDDPLVEFRVRRDANTGLPPTPSGAADSTNSVSAGGSLPALEPITDRIHYLHFSYWDGSAWSENWAGRGLPKGVEVILSLDSHPEGLDPADGSIEIFRRVIALPGADSEPAGGTPGQPSSRPLPSGPLVEVAP